APNMADPSSVIKSTLHTGGNDGAMAGCGAANGRTGGAGMMTGGATRWGCSGRAAPLETICGRGRRRTAPQGRGNPVRRRNYTAVSSALPGGAQHLGRAKPTGLGDVNHHAVRAGPLDLIVAGRGGAGADFDVRTLVDLLSLGGLQVVRGFLHVIDLKTNVVDATVVGTIGAHIGILLRLPVQDGQVNVAIGAMEGTVRAVTDLFHAKCLHVKGSGFFRVFGGQGNVSDSRHDCLLCARCWQGQVHL